MEFINQNNEIIATNDLTLKGSSDNEWDKAHELLDQEVIKQKGDTFIEPNIESGLYTDDHFKLRLKSDELADDGYLDNWPAPDKQDDIFVWHKRDAYSQLDKACATVLGKNKDAAIKIAIIDTGFQPGHPALPAHHSDGISFIKRDEKGPAHDVDSDKFAEQNGHGTATMSILAGKAITKEHSDGKYEGTFGAIPFAHIIPIRICETVAIIRIDRFVEAVEYAIDQGCEVISMSMAGAPTKAWARVVNKAYEAGIVMVTAAGNSWTKGVRKILPKRVLYPARWDRVIAATGIAADHLPYVFDARMHLKFDEDEYMQGNYGPEEAMRSAVAAYTPNVSWGTMNRLDKKKYFSLSGAGTSSETPQVAAAAALYICHHRDAIDKIMRNNPNDKWKKVELVKRALRDSADTSYDHYRKYYGYGSLKADKALAIEPVDTDLEKAPEAKVSFFGILDLLGLLLRLKSDPHSIDESREEMFALEILQHLHNEPGLHDMLNYEETEIWKDADKDKVRNELLSSPKISQRLKDHLASQQNPS